MLCHEWAAIYGRPLLQPRRNSNRSVATFCQFGNCFGHSYGGMIITEAGTDRSVVGLVYIAAYMPDVGESSGPRASSRVGGVRADRGRASDAARGDFYSA
jgi:pimeloyl-ACP methyl ester carboxylesterase